ncbi:cupin domain-containing protein, partial [Mesorhizobium sp.]|uniref:cupin domain-containing protein n=1 Tax=Mesorhizobium sp. TaxID=1871066 RepID=UPI00338FC7D3
MPVPGCRHPIRNPFAQRLIGRIRRPLGDAFGLTRFGVNLTSLEPGGQSSLHHRHRNQDEFIYVLQGKPTLVTDKGENELCPGMCAGFAANGGAH